ncbi:predicted protein [Arabidopsis lyrata subsp. lyrata]|uniref:Predicted protein n=1 Tax=Arabidopsis lyrata subsp. lyrata TaxID=81972 RepID=D7LMC3_ARALL|nr:predicted protein [Arabidopsis lyrata subsp. lyrata]
MLTAVQRFDRRALKIMMGKSNIVFAPRTTFRFPNLENTKEQPALNNYTHDG